MERGRFYTIDQTPGPQEREIAEALMGFLYQRIPESKLREIVADKGFSMTEATFVLDLRPLSRDFRATLRQLR